MADVEALMWLQLGVELGIFFQDEAEYTFAAHQRRLLSSLNYVEKGKKMPRLFKREIDLLVKQVKSNGTPFVEHPRRLRANLFVSGFGEMLLHEIGRCFRDGTLTMCLVLASRREFQRLKMGKLDPKVILRAKSLHGKNLLTLNYLAFLGHAASLDQLWEFLDSVSANNYASFSLKQRVRAIHCWRLDLSENQVRDRFDELTSIFLKSVGEDRQIRKLGLHEAEILAKIETLRLSWEGGDDLQSEHNGEGGGGQGGGGRGGSSKDLKEDLDDVRKPAIAA